MGFGSRKLIQYYLIFKYYFLFKFSFDIHKPAVLEKNDFYKLLKYFLVLSLSMAILITIQFFFPEDHWVNVGPGGFVTCMVSIVGFFFVLWKLLLVLKLVKLSF